MPYNSMFDAYARGKNQRILEDQAAQRNALGQLEIEQQRQFNALGADPNSTPEQYARIGRSDVANALTGQANARRELDAAQKKQFATMMVQAAQYGLQSNTPKAFIEQNYPQLVELAGPQWATADDAMVKAKLQEAIGIFGPVAGIGPPEARGAGALYKYVGQDGNPLYGDAATAAGKTPYIEPNDNRAPSGYRYAANGRLEAIPGGPADPTTPSTKDDSRIFAKADKLRDEFNTQSKEFITVNDNYNTVQQVAANPSAAGDLSMIFAFMKMLDPNSVVREQEFANAQNAAGVPDRVRNAYNKMLNGERLNESQRQDFINQAANLYKSKKARQDAVVKRYTDIAKRNNVNPDDVVGDLGVVLGGAPVPANPQIVDFGSLK